MLGVGWRLFRFIYYSWAPEVKTRTGVGKDLWERECACLSGSKIMGFEIVSGKPEERERGKAPPGNWSGKDPVGEQGGPGEGKDRGKRELGRKQEKAGGLASFV